MSGIEYKETLTIHFVNKQGKVQDVRVPVGMTLMDAARVYAEPTIDEVPGDCGGNRSCGTCHINIKEDIDKVGIVDYNSLETTNSKDKVCSICLGDDNDNEDNLKYKLPNCTHFYHKDCIDKWIKLNNNSCPTCRTVIS